MEVDWLSVDGVPRWFPYGFADWCVHNLVEAVVLAWKRHVDETFDADRM